MKRNSIIAVDIEENKVKIAEIEMGAKSIKPTKTASLELKNVDENGALVNIQRLTDEICEKIKDCGMTAKNIVLCSPFLGGTASLKNAEKTQVSVAEFLQKKPFENIALSGGKAEKSYGTLKKDGKTVEYIIENSADEFLLTELARLFAEHGFLLKSAEYTLTALINLTALAPYTYDNRHKFIIDVSDRVTMMITECDIPIEIRRWNVDFANLSAQITDYALRDMNDRRIKNPLVILCGTRLEESRFKAVKAELESADFTVADIGIQADFAACAGLVLKSGAKTKTNLMPRKTRYFLPPEFKLKAIKFARISACLVAFASTFLCGFTAVRIISANAAEGEIPLLQSELNEKTSQISAMTENFDAVDGAASKLNDFLDFCENYAKTDIFIASADTENVLKPPTLESGLNLAEALPEGDKNRLIVRGYALSGKEALDFYCALQKKDFAPKMNGLQTETLKSGEKITIFELEMMM